MYSNLAPYFATLICCILGNNLSMHYKFHCLPLIFNDLQTLLRVYQTQYHIDFKRNYTQMRRAFFVRCFKESILKYGAVICNNNLPLIFNEQQTLLRVY